ELPLPAVLALALEQSSHRGESLRQRIAEYDQLRPCAGRRVDDGQRDDVDGGDGRRERLVLAGFHLGHESGPGWGQCLRGRDGRGYLPNRGVVLTGAGGRRPPCTRAPA